MALQCGIVGLPNVGKSTLFNTLTQAGVAASNYPFCTIEPNVGVVAVPDERLDRIAKIIKPVNVVPTSVQFVDIAGLVRGASKGEGLGNQFLSHIRQVDAIVHVVRCFQDDNIVHVDGSVEPTRDIDTIETELCLADLDSLSNAVDKLSKKVKGDKSIAEKLEIAQKALAALEDGKSVRSVGLDKEERTLLKDFHLITAKPTLYLCNVHEDDLEGKHEAVQTVVELANKQGATVVILSAKVEAELAELDKEERNEYLSELGLEEPGLNRCIRGAYTLLDLITFFTAGEKECRAWTTRRGASAPEAAGVIHSDFQRGFIKAETYHCDDLFELGSELEVRNKGRLKQEGKDYIVRDGDVMHFKFNV